MPDKKCMWCQNTEQDARRIAELQAALAEAQQTIKENQQITRDNLE